MPSYKILIKEATLINGDLLISSKLPENMLNAEVNLYAAKESPSIGSNMGTIKINKTIKQGRKILDDLG